jgi:hypothetical protein
LNLQQDTEEPYDACPYCLTEIKLDNEPPTAFDEPETFEPEETEEPEKEAEPEVEEMTPHAEEPVETPQASSECSHYLGYLSEKSSKERIPDECMMCKDIVTCMLKKMNE